MRSLIFGVATLAAFALVVTVAPGCGSDDNGGGTSDGGNGDGGPCTGFGCGPGGNDGAVNQCVGAACQVTCDQPGTTTTLSGTVFDPAGKVPVFNATVYIPTTPVADLTEGASCDQCAAKVTGNPLVITATDTSGHFKLENVPVGADFPLVVQIGKWRRQVTVPGVQKCVDTPVADGTVRLPRNRNEGHIPRIAITTGGADPLQCLLRKVGVDDAEFGVNGGDQRIHLYQGGGYAANKLASAKFAASLNGGAGFPTAQSLWDDANATNLMKYDVVLLGCEGGENDVANGACPTCTTGSLKSANAIAGMYKYASQGGRVFASHYHEVWFRKSADAAVNGIATWAVDTFPPGGVTASTTAVNTDISTAFPKAQAMSDWLSKQNALVGGKLPIVDARHDIDAVSSNALSWVSVLNSATPPGGSPVNKTAVEYMSFNTPVGAADNAVCGRVVINDIHVASGGTDDPQADFPTGCTSTDLTAQQKALEFMLFDLSSCIQKDDQAIQPPH